MLGRMVDLVFYLRIDYANALERMRIRNEKLTAFEQEHESFFRRVIHGFEELYQERSNVIVLDARQEPQELLRQAITHIEDLIGTRTLIQQS